MPTHARERLVETAKELFFAEGIQAVGLERLLSVSGVGRASFYRHFASKDELVVEVLRERDRNWRAWLAEAVDAHGGTPLALFDAVAEDCAKGDFRGCAFTNAMSELAETDGPVHDLARRHKQAVTDYVTALLHEAGQDEPEALARQFVLLMDGATVTAARERDVAATRGARDIAARLLEDEPTP